MNKNMARRTIVAQSTIALLLVVVILLVINHFRTPISHSILNHKGSANMGSSLSYFATDGLVYAADTAAPTGCSCPNCCPVRS